MTPIKEHIKVLSTLSLAASDTRIDTLKSVILSTLKQTKEIEVSETVNWIHETFGFTPYKEEILKIVEDLINDGEIERTDNNMIRLTENSFQKIGELETKLKDQDKQRFENFSTFIREESSDISTPKLKLLWATFIEYLYNHFFDYGEEALKRLHPHIRYEKTLDKEDDFQKIAFEKLKDEKLCSVFKIAVEKFPDYASSDDIDFLNDLAQKTLSFASLGIDPKLANQSIDLSLIDWVLYLDTNVLYSLLNLHTHPENEACRALVSLINENKEHLNISLRYSEMTKKELNNKRNDFGLLDDKLTDSGIRALLRSDKLDDFSTQFYNNLLENRESTIHPSKVIDLSPNLLRKDKIDISRNAKRINEIGDDYIETRIQDYHLYISERNKLKQEFCEIKEIPFYPIYKRDNQVIHDVKLRELILHLRKSNLKSEELVTFNKLKYFGVTLDGILRDYDTSRTKDYDDEQSFPVFFRPSFLLNKLVKVLPIKTGNYKKAFIKAVTSKGFNKDVKKSHDVLKIVNFLKSQGIDNEEIVFNLISKDLFLDEYRSRQKHDDFNEKEFIESELNFEFNRKETELQNIKKQIADQNKQVESVKSEKVKYSIKYQELEQELGLYKNAIRSLRADLYKVKERGKGIDLQQSKLDFETATVKSELLKKNKQLKANIEKDILRYKIGIFKKWQQRVFWNLIWVIPLIVLTLSIVLNPDYFLSITVDKTSIRIIIGFFLLFFDGIFFYLVKMKYFDENNKQKKLENIEVPFEFQERLNSIKE